jgi:hypothetical protein
MKLFAIALLALITPMANATLLSDLFPGAEPLKDQGREIFEITDTDGVDDDINALFLLTNDGRTNSGLFGLYNLAAPALKLQVFDGTTATAFSTTALIEYALGAFTFNGNTVDMGGSRFGFYWTPDGSQETFYSQSALNGGYNAMIDFDTEGKPGITGLFDQVVAFEDRSFGSPLYDDYVVGLTDVQGVPVSGTAGLMALGLLAMRSRKKKA